MSQEWGKIYVLRQLQTAHSFRKSVIFGSLLQGLYYTLVKIVSILIGICDKSYNTQDSP